MKQKNTKVLRHQRVSLLWSSNNVRVIHIFWEEKTQQCAQFRINIERERERLLSFLLICPPLIQLIDLYTWSIVKFVKERTANKHEYTPETEENQDKKNYNNMINIRINWWRLMAINNIFIVPFSSSNHPRALSTIQFSYLFVGVVVLRMHKVIAQAADSSARRGEIWFKDAYQLGFFSLENNRLLIRIEWHDVCRIRNE